METNKKRLKLKVNSQNEITIRKIKDSFSRKEVESLIKKFANTYSYANNEIGYNKWISENL